MLQHIPMLHYVHLCVHLNFSLATHMCCSCSVCTCTCVLPLLPSLICYISVLKFLLSTVHSVSLNRSHRLSLITSLPTKSKQQCHSHSRKQRWQVPELEDVAKEERQRQSEKQSLVRLVLVCSFPLGGFIVFYVKVK